MTPKPLIPLALAALAAGTVALPSGAALVGAESSVPPTTAAAGSVPTPQPITFTGTGDKVIALSAEEQARKAMRVVHHANGTYDSITVVAKDDQGTPTGTIVLFIGGGEGVFDITPNSGRAVTQLDVHSTSGGWTIELLHEDSLAREAGPTISGDGSRVFHYTGQTQVFTVDYRGSDTGSLLITVRPAAEGSTPDLPVMEIGATYHGTVTIQGPSRIEVKANGKWTMTAGGATTSGSTATTPTTTPTSTTSATPPATTP